MCVCVCVSPWENCFFGAMCVCWLRLVGSLDLGDVRDFEKAHRFDRFHIYKGCAFFLSLVHILNSKQVEIKK